VEARDVNFLQNVVGSVEIEVDELGGACGTNGEKINAYRFLMGYPKEKKTQVYMGRWL
jgi:hypothetical protein